MNDPASFGVNANPGDDRVVRVSIEGRLDMRRYSEVESTVLAWLDRGYADLRLDLGKLESLTTVAAVGVVALLRLAQDKGGRVEVVEPPAPIVAVFRELEVADLMPWVEPH
ncbi:MAG: STAS domain-containing protein [Planctomycetota bacterium]